MDPAAQQSWQHRDFASASLPSSAQLSGAKFRLDAHVQEMMKWHFSDSTGCPYWLDMRSSLGFDPINDIRSFEDLVAKFPNFDAGVLKYNEIDHLIPRGFEGKPYSVYLTGGTTSGAPSRRPGWKDFEVDYAEFSETVEDCHFPRGGKWLYAGPSGPRRLPDAIRYLSQLRGGIAQGIDCDPVGVKGMINAGFAEAAQWYADKHVVGQILRNLDTKQFSSMFTSPPLLEQVVKHRDLYECGIRGVFFGGTEISPEWMHIMMEEVGPNVGLYPTYGNTLMGLAKHAPVTPENNYAVIYYAPQPRAVIRLVDPKDTSQVVPYGGWGQVQLTTMTKEFFAPCYLERDEARRREPCEQYPWDGVEFVRPLGTSEGKKTVTGVY
jgi:hypothetical protein